MTQEQLDQHNITQQVLRGLVSALVVTNAINGKTVAELLNAFAASSDIEPLAKTLLADLAMGAANLEQMKPQRH